MGGEGGGDLKTKHMPWVGLLLFVALLCVKSLSSFSPRALGRTRICLSISETFLCSVFK